MPRKKKVNPQTGASLMIQFVGKRQIINKKTGKLENRIGEAPVRRRNGSRVIDLPSSTEQIKGFTHPDAEFLLSAYPKEFKRKVLKGKK